MHSFGLTHSFLLRRRVLSPPGPVLQLFPWEIEMGQVLLYCGRMPVPIPPHIPNVVAEAMPVKTKLFFCALVTRQMLHGEWLENVAKPLSIGIRVEE